MDTETERPWRPGGVCRMLLDLTGWDGERRRRDAARACLKCPEPCPERLRCFPDGLLSKYDDGE